MTDRPRRPPVSTYRLQLHGACRFDDARRLVPYLSSIGITDCYSSPHFKANPGSLHGYDICDHSALNPELGTEDDYVAFCDALAAEGMGHIADIVPNHMAADPLSNPWWRDVLENGPSSPYAHYFDIDWQPVKDELHGKVLLPVLGDQYGKVLERGELKLSMIDGALQLRYFERNLPISPRESPRVLRLHLERLEASLAGEPALREYLSIVTALENLPSFTERESSKVVQRQREKEVARERLARLIDESPAIARHVAAAVEEANGTAGVPGSFDFLHQLLERQAYRLAYWRTAFDEVNYRRFFDVNELVGLRMEDRHVFDAAHVLVKRLVDQGRITGLRVDHPDGLADPVEYFERLHALCDEPLYVVAEKILSPGETIGPDWKVHGTTGYGYLNLVNGLFVDSRHARKLRRIYLRLTGRTESFEEVAYRSRLTIMLTSMASELNVLAHALNRISEGDRRFRDFTLSSCRRVLREVTACFPVYRTYVSARGASPFDRQSVDEAIAEARRRNPVMEGSIFGFLREVLLALPAEGADESPRARERLHFAMNVQQFTAPVFAKGVEDTACYRYHVLISANDVGGHPGRLASTPEEFHAANARRLADWPLELNATATHDTKRGEDARMRINAISEVPDEWRRAVAAWMRTNARNRTKLAEGWAPDRNDEYFFYQALLGSWPAESDSAPVPAQAPPDLVERLERYALKAVREAKIHTSWIHEAPEYGQAVSRFVTRTLDGRRASRFLGSFVPFARRLARTGMVNSLAQLVLKVASPGVADFYQGTELWDLNLVDPDNRRPVDFEARCRAAAEIRPLVQRLEDGGTASEDVRRLVEGWVDARIKLFVMIRALRFRRAQAELLIDGAYEPLACEGPGAGHIVAFARRGKAGTLVVAVPRLTMSIDASAWIDTTLVLPPSRESAEVYRHLLTGERLDPERDRLSLARLFATTPVALAFAGNAG